MTKHQHLRFQTKRGAASLFIVVFSVLLLTIIVLSFLRIALRGVRTASENDLSQSAYDSAMAGVEDAKRALAKYSSQCQECIMGGACDEACGKLRTDFTGKNCDVIKNTLGGSGVDEQTLKAGGSKDGANQAYTCVKIIYNTDDFLGKLETDGDIVTIPLKPYGQPVKYVEIKWFSEQDLSSNSTDRKVDLTNVNSLEGAFPSGSEWPANRPPVIVAQHFKLSPNLVDYDITASPAVSRTLFLVPNRTGLEEASFSSDGRGVGEQQIVPANFIKCSQDLSSVSYACRVKMELALNGELIPAGSNNHYLRLSKRYFSKANYQVSMLNESGGLVQFAGVQPAVDSNGRADSMFRRVEVRLQPTGAGTFPQPQGAVEIAKGDFCKDIVVSDKDKAPNCNN